MIQTCYRLFFVLTIINIFSAIPHSFAAQTIVRGGSATINWKVEDAPNCVAGSNYTGALSDVNNWDGRTLAPSGNETFLSVKTPGAFTFTCNYAGTIGSDTLTVQDCGGALSPGTTWNGSSCAVAASPTTASLTISASGYGTNVHSISYPAGTANPPLPGSHPEELQNGSFFILQ